MVRVHLRQTRCPIARGRARAGRRETPTPQVDAADATDADIPDALVRVVVVVGNAHPCPPTTRADRVLDGTTTSLGSGRLNGTTLPVVAAAC